jgi:iron(III) transport system ATP-binding protein
MDRSARRSGAADELLAMVGMSGLGRRYPHQLSGGQQQRVALARALAVRPQLVLLDEPFSSLDASLRASVRADVRDVLRQAGTTAVLVTHDQDEALSWADHVAIIRDGRIGQFDTPHDVYGRPVDADLARFLGDANLLAGVADGRSVRTVMGVLPIADGAPAPAPGEAMVVLVRPEQVELIAEPRGAYLTGEVVDYQYFGHDAVVRVRPDRDGLSNAPAASDAGGAPTGSGPPGADGSAGQATPVVVRVTGGAAWAPGRRVGLTTRGPVQAWPAPKITSA